LNVLTLVTERLCDLLLEESDLTLKELVLDRVFAAFTNCLVHVKKAPTSYTKADQDELLGRHNTSSSSSTGLDSPT